MLLKSEPLSEDLGLLVLRVGAGGGMLWQHGWPKLTGFAERMDQFGDPIGLGPAFSLGLITFAEVVCALMVLLGLWTRITTVPLMIGMAVIVFVVKAGKPFGDMELPLLYLLMYLAIFLCGSGRFSLDRLTFQ